ncbi:MAG: DUF1800 domain-containing protein [Bacteroidetes bacterium]|nr:DUF1800 domain-containing protein [Bacteroidota bacterium]
MASLNPITSPLSREQAAHLLRRATFGPTRGEIASFTGKTISEAILLLLDDTTANPSPPIDTATGSTWVDPAAQARADPERDQNELFSYFQCWHMDVMRQAPNTLKERITWFFHTHLPARWTEIKMSEAIYYQNALFRHYAYGSFKELFKKICVDNAMLRYLDGYSNRFRSPNENFAREMFELYGIGKGKQLEEGDYTNYTEDDIKEATRVLTGWMIDETFSHLDAETGLPVGMIRSSTEGEGAEAKEVAIEHDPGVKTFTEKFGGRSIQPAEIAGGYPTVESAYGELDEMIEMIFEQQETGRFIARKLYRFFVYHFITDEVEDDIIDPLAQVLIDNDYSIVEALKRLLSSQHFFDNDDLLKENDNIGALIKSPVDLACGLFRSFKMGFPDRETDPAEFYTNMGFVIDRLVDQGLNFYEPFEVAGYPAYHQIPGYNRNWITTYALAHRYQAGDLLMEPPGGENGLSIYLDVVEWVENSGDVTSPSDAAEIMLVLTENLLAVSLTQERSDYFLYTVFLDYPEDQAYARGLWSQEWSTYQNSGNDETVRLLLERLISAMIQTPEFQLY